MISLNQKRILIVTDAWHPQVNGVVRVVEAQKPYIEEAGYEVEILHTGYFATMPLPLYAEIKIALFPMGGVKKFIEERKPDAVHIVTEGPIGRAARRYCMKRGIPFTTWYHTHYQLYIDIRIPGLLRIVHAILRRFHNAGVRTMVSTQSLKENLEAAGFEHVVVVPLGVDTERFVRSNAVVFGALHKPVFAYFSRLAPEKSPEEFFRLKLPGTKLVIGDGPDRFMLEKKYKDALFVGYQKGQELVDWLSRVDVLVFPSRTETFGLVQLEALSCGVPVAAHDVMGPRDLITDGVDGYLSDNLEEAAVKCLDLPRENCRKKAEQYSWKKSAEGLVENLEWIK